MSTLEEAYNIVNSLSTIEDTVRYIQDLTIFKSALQHIYPKLNTDDLDLTYFVEVIAYLLLVKKIFNIDVNEYIATPENEENRFIKFIDILKSDIEEPSIGVQHLINSYFNIITERNNISMDNFLTPYWNHIPELFMDMHTIKEDNGVLNIGIYYIRTSNSIESEDLTESQLFSIYELMTDKMFDTKLSHLLSFIQNRLRDVLLSEEAISSRFSDINIQVHFITNENNYCIQITDTDVFNLPLIALDQLYEGTISKEGFDKLLGELSMSNDKLVTVGLGDDVYDNIEETLNELPNEPIAEVINYIMKKFNL